MPNPPPKVLRWAADTSSGAPYVFQDPDHPSQLIGFEVDLIDALAAELGMTTQFVQNQWDGLIPGLKRGEYDLAINGIEITPDRSREVAFSKPYYLTSEQLTVRQGTTGLTTLADCRGKAVGTIQASLAERMLRAEGGVDIRTYEDEINAYQDLAFGRIDAVLLDYPIALYYAAPDPYLAQVGEPIGQLAYGMAMRKGEVELVERINAAYDRLVANGMWAKILAKWNLWTPAMANYLRQAAPQGVEPTGYTAYLKAIHREAGLWAKVRSYGKFLPLFFWGAARTLQISLLSMLLAVSTGLLIAITRLYLPRPFQLLSTLYVETIRGTPLLIQLFFVFYALPNVGLQLSPMVAAVLGLGLNYAAYESENYRAGILSVPKGQMEAARALGMSQWQALRYVVLPQSVRMALPPVTNDFISLLKDSSLVSVITMVELTKVYTQVSAATFDYFGTGVIVAA
ncbi:MAG TPA: ABC transporter substrate-binding protein/permease, partial [Candidatus Binatia bacterium]|nr:ABC transporter substrate-binding protein/permease [Candidatus Binatia bacterium]